jgi:hypothetical protein
MNRDFGPAPSDQRLVGLALVLGAVFGAAAGAALGALRGDVGGWIGIGIPIGVSVGLAAGALFTKSSRPDAESAMRWMTVDDDAPPADLSAQAEESQEPKQRRLPAA